MAITEEEKKDKDIESVAQPDADVAFRGKNEEIGQAFRDTEADSYQVLNRANERAAKRVPELEAENEQLKIELGNLSKVIDPEEKPAEKRSGLEKFISGVGQAFTGVFDGMEKKLDEVYKDKSRRAQFLQGLNTVIEASSFKPISQASSPLGMFAKGQKKGFLESEAIGTKRAEIEAKKSSTASKNLIESLKLQESIKSTEDKRFEPLYKRLAERNKDLAKATQNEQYFDQLKKLTAKQIIDSGEIPVGLIYSKFPKGIQAVVDILPASIKGSLPDDFVSSIENEAVFLQQINKLTDSMVLGDISQLVPVSDKDVEIKRQTLPSDKNSPLAFVYSLRTQDAINKINAFKNSYLDKFQADRGFQNKKSFNESFNTEGATLIKDDLLSKYTPDELYEEARKLGFSPDYDKYIDNEVNFSPMALAEAAASIDLGGFNNYSKVTSVNLGGDKTKTPEPEVSEGLKTNEQQIDEATKELETLPDLVPN